MQSFAFCRDNENTNLLAMFVHMNCMCTNHNRVPSILMPRKLVFEINTHLCYQLIYVYFECIAIDLYEM